MTRGSQLLTEDLREYLLAHSSQRNVVLSELIQETALKFPDWARMQISEEQGLLMTMLVRLMKAKTVLEIGTFTGYSAICLASGLPPGGKLICCDVNVEWTNVAIRYWKKLGLESRIDLRIGPGLETLSKMQADTIVDLAFIDANKSDYINYWNAVVPKVRCGGLILVDNTLSQGRVIDHDDVTPHVKGIKDFNAHAVTDKRVELVMLPIGDGLTFCRKL